MPELTLQERFDKLLTTFQKTNFLDNQGIGNEIGFYIFDYAPEHEPTVTKHLQELKLQLLSLPKPVQVREINLYESLLNLLETRGLLQKVMAMEVTKGSQALQKKIKPLVRSEKVIEQIQKQLDGKEELIFLTGVGASYPLLRSHTILNNLHDIFDQIPLVMFFPGAYDGHELRLFNILKDDNYYRAFRLIPRQELAS